MSFAGRWELACRPEIAADSPEGTTTLRDPISFRTVRVDTAHLELLELMGPAFTYLDLYHRASRLRPLTLDAYRDFFLRLVDAGILRRRTLGGSPAGERSINPLAALQIPWIYVPVFLAAMGYFVYRSDDAWGWLVRLREPQPPGFWPALAATALTLPFLRQLFRGWTSQSLTSARQLRLRLKGLIPVLEAAFPLRDPANPVRKWQFLTSGLLFDLLALDLFLILLPPPSTVAPGQAPAGPLAGLGVGACILIVSLNPLARYDLYEIFSELLHTRRLRGRSRAALRAVRRRRLSAENVLLALYHLCTVAYFFAVTALICAALYHVVSGFLRPGTPGMLRGAALGLILLVSLPVARRVLRPLLRSRAGDPEEALLEAEPGPAGATSATASAVWAAPCPLEPHVLDTRLSPDEGYPLGFRLVDAHHHWPVPFSRLSSSLTLYLLPGAAAGRLSAGLERWHRRGEATPVDVLELSRTVFGRDVQELGPEEQLVLRVCHALTREGYPAATHRFVPCLTLLDGNHEFGLLDNTVRMGSFQPTRLLRLLTSNHASDLAMRLDDFLIGVRNVATQRFEAFVLLDRAADEAERRLRLDTLTGCFDRTRQWRAAWQDSDTPPPDPAPAASGIRSSPADRAPDEPSLPTGGTGRQLDPEQLEAALRHLARVVPAVHYETLARTRGCPVGFLERYDIIPCLEPLSPEQLDPGEQATLQAVGFLRAVTLEGETRLRCQLPGPALLFPLGSAGRPTGLKARMLSPRLRFDFAASPDDSLRRFRQFYLRRATSNVLAEGDRLEHLPGWYSVRRRSPDLVIFEGELKAMAFEYLFDADVISIGGLHFNNLRCLAAAIESMPHIRRIDICFDQDSLQAYQQHRIDLMTDAQVRTLQLSRMIQSRTDIEVSLVAGLSDQAGNKLDMDDLLGMGPDAQARYMSIFMEQRAAARTTISPLSRPDVRHYIDALNDFAMELFDLIHARYLLECKQTEPVAGWDRWIERAGRLQLKALELRRISPTTCPLGSPSSVPAQWAP